MFPHSKQNLIVSVSRVMKTENISVKVQTISITYAWRILQSVVYRPGKPEKNNTRISDKQKQDWRIIWPFVLLMYSFDINTWLYFNTSLYKIWSSTFSVKPRQNIFKSIVQFDFAKVTNYMFLSIFKYYVLHSSIDWNISSCLNTPDNFCFNIYGRIKENFGCFDFSGCIIMKSVRHECISAFLQSCLSAGTIFID